MIGISVAEILTILLIVLIVFGPRRLPELARRTGRVLRDLRAAAADLRDGIEAARDDDAPTLGQLRRSLGPTIDDPDDGPAPERPGPQDRR